MFYEFIRTGYVIIVDLQEFGADSCSGFTNYANFSAAYQRPQEGTHSITRFVNSVLTNNIRNCQYLLY